MFNLFGAHCDAHEFKRTAEIVLGVLKVHRVYEYARAGPSQQCQGRFLHDADVHLTLPQRFEQIDAHGRELDLAGVTAGLLQQAERQGMIGSAERDNADRPSLQVLDASYLSRGLWSRDNREWGEPTDQYEAPDDRGDSDIGLNGNVQRGGGVVIHAADQCLHGSDAAAAMNQLHVKPMIFEVAGRARDFIRHPAQELAAIGELDLLALRLCASGSRRRDDARDQRGALEQRAPRHVGIGYAGGGFIAATHGSLQTLPRGALQSSEMRWAH